MRDELKRLIDLLDDISEVVIHDVSQMKIIKKTDFSQID